MTRPEYYTATYRERYTDAFGLIPATCNQVNVRYMRQLSRHQRTHTHTNTLRAKRVPDGSEAEEATGGQVIVERVVLVAAILRVDHALAELEEDVRDVVQEQHQHAHLVVPEANSSSVISVKSLQRHVTVKHQHSIG